MDIWIAFFWVLFIGLIVALAFWGRGLVKSNRGDMIAGWCIFCVMCIFGVFAGSSPIMLFLGVALIALGIVTITAGELSGPNRHLERSSRLIITIGLIMLGLLFLLVL